MKLTYFLPLTVASMVRAATPTDYHSMASAIWAGLGGSETNNNNPPKESEPDSTLASSRPLSTMLPPSNRTTSDLNSPPAVSTSDRKPNSAGNGNSASSRSRWGQHNVDTDYENVIPDTGVTREYWLDLIQVTLSPDGIPRNVMTINGTMPGPTLTADWGDFIVVHVRNSLFESQNGTSIHWYVN